MAKAVTRVVVPDHHNLVKRLGENTGEDEIIKELSAFQGSDDDAGEGHAEVRSTTYPNPVGFVPVPPCTQTLESVLWDGLILMAR